MLIATVLHAKGEFVATLAPDASVQQLLDVLAEHRIGAVVVSSDDRIVGIASERDVVRRLRDRSDPTCWTQPVDADHDRRRRHAVVRRHRSRSSWRP